MKQVFEELNVLETILLIQEQAYAAIGINRYRIKEKFIQEKRELEFYLSQNPHFLRPKSEVLKKDPSLKFIDFDLPNYYDSIVEELPYQNPFLFTWLSDVFKHHQDKLGKHPLQKPVILASAPTGRFNAISIFGDKQDGILFEDGLMHVSKKIAHKLSLIFYDKISDGKFRELNKEEWSDRVDTSGQVEGIAEIVTSYIFTGYDKTENEVAGDYKDDFSIRHVLFIAFISFVIDHENFHLAKKNGLIKDQPQFFQDRYAKIWGFFNEHLAKHLPVSLEESDFKSAYQNHQEELLADVHGMKSVLKIAEMDNTISSSLLGVMMFFLILELVEFTMYSIKEPEFLDNLYHTDGLTLSLTAIVMRESHPYAHIRRQGMVSAMKLRYPQHSFLIEELNQKTDYLLEKIKSKITLHIQESPEELSVHPKWEFGKSGIYEALST